MARTTVAQEAEDMQRRQQEAVSYAALPLGEQKQRLTELATVFLRLGAIAFGGPAAHIAMMDNEVVNQRQWMSREKLLLDCWASPT